MTDISDGRSSDLNSTSVSWVSSAVYLQAVKSRCKNNFVFSFWFVYFA